MNEKCIAFNAQVESDQVWNHRLHKSLVEMNASLYKPAEENYQRTFASKTYHISFYNTAPYITLSPHVIESVDFKKCEFKNCILVHDEKDTRFSDAVIFDGRFLGTENVAKPPLRPPGQVWIFAAHESPAYYKVHGTKWMESPWKSSFNWTMTYDKSNSDIFLPYGEIRKHAKGHNSNRNFTEIALQKTDGALIVVSHCDTDGKREVYLNELKKYFPIKVLGKCGEKWDCGHQYTHDDCFDILLNTTYKFYLAFENSLCREYYTEKFFENYNNDILLITRGGFKNDSLTRFPKSSHISTDQFKSAKALGEYMTKIANDPSLLARLLKDKSQYYGVGYTEAYPRAMCQLCKMMNNQRLFRRQILDIGAWAYCSNPCRKPDDLK